MGKVRYKICIFLLLYQIKVNCSSLSLWTRVSVLSEAVPQQANCRGFIPSFHHPNPIGIMWIKTLVMVFKVSTATFCLMTVYFCRCLSLFRKKAATIVFR